MAALCMAGESEWATGSPRTANSRVLAPISTLPLPRQPLGDGRAQRLELGAGIAIDVEVAAERVAHFRFLAFAPGVLAQHEHAALAAQLLDARPMMPRHREHQVGALHQLAREQPRAVPRKVESALEPHEIRALRGGRAVPRAGAGRADFDLREAARR